MPRRERDYAAEYARRKQLHSGDISKARGHVSPEYERMQRLTKRMEATKAPWEQFNSKDVYKYAKQHGVDKVLEALELRKAMQDAYNRGDTALASSLYRQRNPDLPDWLHHYRGYFGL